MEMLKGRCFVVAAAAKDERKSVTFELARGA
jgi:hypothetical protein